LGADLPDRVISYLSEYWQGRQGWLWSLLVNLLALRLMLTLVPDIPAGGALLIGFMTLSLCLLLWQLVGGWRTAGVQLRDTGDMFPVLALYGGMLVAVVLAVTQIIDRVAGYYAVEEKVFAAEVPALEVADNGRVLLATGPIDFAMNTALREGLRQNPGIRSLRINSKGGSIFAARGMAKAVLAAGLATEVTGMCYSACTIVFMAGNQRRLGPEGMLGFHGYAFDPPQRVPLLDMAEEEARGRAFFATRGVEAGFLDRAFATPPSELWLPTRAELVAAGVILE
jgi:hypothetical protein